MLKTISKLAISSITACTILQADVTISTDNTGDFLIAPLYLTTKDICSHIRVLNTNEYSSILAKVTIREQVASHEVDLPIFLSPGDVWDGKICQVNGKATLFSSDDSNHPSALDILASGMELETHSIATQYRENDYNSGIVELNGKQFKLQELQKTNVDFNKGYIEVYPIAQFDEGSKDKVHKKVLVQRWDRLIDGQTLPRLRKNGVDENSLTGSVSFMTAFQETAAMKMTAFKNTHSKQILGDAINYTSDSSPDILLDKNSKSSMWNLLQKDKVSFFYDNCGKNQYIYFAYPFSYRELQKRTFKIMIRDKCENKYSMVFSPKFIMKNELACISVENLIKLTHSKNKFQTGMIQLEDITNSTGVQLGRGKIASSIPTLTRIKTIGGRDMVINAMPIASH